MSMIMVRSWWIWRCLIAAALAWMTVSVHAAPMVLLDRGLVEAQALGKGKQVRGKPFQLERAGEPVWVAIDLTAEATAGEDAEGVIEFFLDGVSIPITDTVGLFRARFMPKIAGQATDVRRSVLMKMIPTGKWQPGTETFATFEVKRTEGMVPLRLSYVIGQGELSPELQAAVEQIRGSWFQRYNIVVLLIGAGVFLGGVVLWRLMRSS